MYNRNRDCTRYLALNCSKNFLTLLGLVCSFVELSLFAFASILDHHSYRATYLHYRMIGNEEDPLFTFNNLLTNLFCTCMSQLWRAQEPEKGQQIINVIKTDISFCNLNMILFDELTIHFYQNHIIFRNIPIILASESKVEKSGLRFRK